MRLLVRVLLILGLITGSLQPLYAAEDIIRIGFNIPLTGSGKSVALITKNAGEMLLKEVMNNGGLQVGDKTYKLEFIYTDNESSSTGALHQTLSLITIDKVLGIIGPLFSRQAIPAGQVANSFSTPLISPWSTSLATTRNRPYIFRAPTLIGPQSTALTKFAKEEFGANKAAVLFDIVNAYPRFMAKDFKAVFEKESGAGSVVAFEEFRTGDTNFRKQLQRIIDSDADILFLPQHYDEVPLIVTQAKKMGWTKPILGSNSWASGDLVGPCGEACVGAFFSGNYTPGGVQGIAKEFADAYMQEYGVLPDEVAALTWDSARLLLDAIKATGGLSGNLLLDRRAIREQIATMKDYEGATGTFTFNDHGDPYKCVIITQITEAGHLTLYKTYCP